MKKVLFLGILPIVLGIIAGVLRGYELAFCYDLQNGMPIKGLGITYALAILAAVILVVAIALSVKRKFEVKEASKSLAHTLAALLGAAVMLALAAYVFVQNQEERDVITLIFSAVCLLNAFAFALLGIKNLKNNENAIYSFMTLVPVLWACIALILLFKGRIIDPIYEHYVFIVFAYICILMFCYAQTGYVFGKNRLWVTVVSTVLGAFLCAIEVVAPFAAGMFSPQYAVQLDIVAWLPALLFAVYMPCAATYMLRNENDVK